MSADLSVVICSLDGAAGVSRCLNALAEQKTSACLEIIVVDDGSSDNTSEIAGSRGVRVIRHPVNRGIAAARNTGMSAAAAPIIAYLDDDCEPSPHWAEGLLAGYGPQVAGVGGPIMPQPGRGLVLSYLNRHNPLQPQELNLATSDRMLYRLGLYLQRQWRPAVPAGRRDVYALVGANMSFRREVLLAAGGFDERFRFGAEELDFCLRLRGTRPPGRLVFVPDAIMTHHFRPGLRDALRRSRAYGRGSARLYRKWPDLPPTVFPWPVIVAATLAVSVEVPVLAAVALALPLLLYPQGARVAIAGRRLSCLLDAYIQLGQETCEDLGFAEGLWRFRGLVPQRSGPPHDVTEFDEPRAGIL